MDQNESDLCLVEKVRGGESQAFGKIAARYQNALLQVAQAALGSADDAADAVQDALVLAYLHLHQLQDPNRLGAWLRRVTVNACRRQARTRKPTVALDAVVETGLDDGKTIDTRLLVEQALACLSSKVRLTVALYYQCEMSTEEIAAFQEVPVTTIKSRLRNARARLRKELETTMTESMTQQTNDLTPQVLNRIETAGRMGAVAVSPDGAVLVTSVALEVTEEKFDARIAAWDIATGNPLWTAELTSWFRDVLFTPSGRYILLATGLPGRRDGFEGRLLFLDAATGKFAREIKTASGAFGLALSPNGQFAATGHSERYTDYRSHGDKGVARIYNLTSGEPVQVFEPHLNYIATVAFSPDGKTIATSGLLRDADPEAKEIWLRADVRLWDLATGKMLHRLERPNARGTVHNLAFSPDGALLAAPNGPEGEVLLWNPTSGDLVKTLPGSGERMITAAFSPDGKTLAVGGDDGKVRLFDTGTWRIKETWEDHKDQVRTLVFSPDGARLISAGMEGTVHIRRLRPGG